MLNIKIIKAFLNELQRFQVWKPIPIKVRYSLSVLLMTLGSNSVTFAFFTSKIFTDEKELPCVY